MLLSKFTLWNLDLTVVTLEETAPHAGHRLEPFLSLVAVDVLSHIILCCRGLSCPLWGLW